MKKIILALIVLMAFAFTSNAQSDTLKPREGDWGFSLNITGIINNIVIENNQDTSGQYNLFARHYLKDDLALRLGFGVIYLKQSTFNEDSISLQSGNRALQVSDSSVSKFDFKVSVGIEKHLGNTRRLDPYLGADLSIIRLGATKTNVNVDKTDVTGTEKRQRTIQADGGVGFGLAGVAGFNYFISRNFSLGVEFGYGLVYSKSGGDVSDSDNTTPVSGASTNSFKNWKSGVSNTTIGASPTGGIMLSFFF